MSELAFGGAWGAFLIAGALLCTRGRRPLYLFRSFFWGASGTAVPAALMTGDWTMAALAAAALVMLAWDKWGRKGKRAVKAVGAKSAALLAAVVEKARQAGTPLPEGAKA